MKCALLTSREIPNLITEEKPLLSLFKNKGIDAQAVIWDSEQDWTKYNFAVVRNTWDYFVKYPQFMRALAAVENSGCLLFNSLETIKRNIDKTYLLELATKGCKVFPTTIIQDLKNTDFLHFFSIWETDKLILKPTVSAGGYHTYLLTPQNFREITTKISDLGLTFLLQPFAHEITTEGEWSFIFFGKRFSHAVLKFPASGDFRVQQEYGGRSTLQIPSIKDLACAQHIVDHIADGLLYARVDMVMWKGSLCLMELELIEPQLFFSFHPISLKWFINRFCELVDTGRKNAISDGLSMTSFAS